MFDFSSVGESRIRNESRDEQKDSVSEMAGTKVVGWSQWGGSSSKFEMDEDDDVGLSGCVCTSCSLAYVAGIGVAYKVIICTC